VKILYYVDVVYSQHIIFTFILYVVEKSPPGFSILSSIALLYLLQVTICLKQSATCAASLVAESSCIILVLHRNVEFRLRTWLELCQTSHQKGPSIRNYSIMQSGVKLSAIEL